LFPPLRELEEGDRLFNTAGAWEHTTRLDWDFLRDYRYVGGFERAAEVLAEHVARHRADADALTMPLLFCYRHWVELRLKDLWVLGGRMRGDAVDPLATHDLRVLWRHVRPVIEEAWPDGDRAELDRLEVVLHELADVDGPKGDGFRYAYRRSGDPSLDDALVIDLANVKSVMVGVGLLLNGAAEGIHEMIDLRREMEAYYREG
jgi:hypothetical protein